MLLAGTLLRTCYEEKIIEEDGPWNISSRVLEFDQAPVYCDKVDHILLYPLPSDTVHAFSPHVDFGAYESITFDGKELLDGARNELGQVMVKHPYEVTAHNGRQAESYWLYFTNLPVLHIHTVQKIRDEPKVLSWMELVNTNQDVYEGYSGIEIRGRTSANYEKKSYGLELWENWHGDAISLPLLGMRSGEDWILDAMYVDPLRMRNKVSFELWEKMWENGSHIPFLTMNPGMQSRYMELFINQRYMGLYCLFEKLDEHLLHLAGAGSWTGEVLYKAFHWTGGATAFTTYNHEPGNAMTWEGWEQIYPEHDYYWEPLAELRKSVLYDPDELFMERIDSLMSLDAAAEYYLFVNLLLAHDNIIKNYLLARYADTTSFLWLPWDLEGSWGIMWDGAPCSSGGFLHNGLFDRLLELDEIDFMDVLEYKWEYYRAGIFQQDSLTAPFIDYADLLGCSGAIERENQRWPGVEIDLDAELVYLLQWIPQRLENLDQVFD
jgi:hypothetical protein